MAGGSVVGASPGFLAPALFGTSAPAFSCYLRGKVTVSCAHLLWEEHHVKVLSRWHMSPMPHAPCGRGFVILRDNLILSRHSSGDISNSSSGEAAAAITMAAAAATAAAAVRPA